MPTEIKHCSPYKPTLAAEWQDKTYGKSERVHNQLLAKKGDQKQWRCTICSNVKT